MQPPLPAQPVGEAVVIRPSPQSRVLAQRIALPVLIVLSALLILLGKTDEAAFDPLRSALADAAAPVLGMLSRPLAAADDLAERGRNLIAVYRQNARLREENARLLHWQQAARALAVENAELRRLLKLVPEATGSSVTARVISNSGGSYVRNLLVDAGRDAGVARGQAALTGDGLVGRVAEVGKRTARILLVTDLNSRVPVVVGGARRRAILAGDNSSEPFLEYLAPSAAIAVGDRVATSGQGGLFPLNVPVGVVASLAGGKPRVALFARPSRVEFLRIVDTGLARSPQPAPRDGRGGPRGVANRTGHGRG